MCIYKTKLCKQTRLKILTEAEHWPKKIDTHKAFSFRFKSHENRNFDTEMLTCLRVLSRSVHKTYQLESDRFVTMMHLR